MEDLDKIRPLWIDTDPGIDDAFCLLTAFRMETFEVVGISAVNGNVDVDRALKNTLFLTDRLDWHVPVFRGEEEPLSEKAPERGVHGSTGLGTIDTDKERIRKSAELDDAVDGLYKTAKELGELDILAIGPLTNIAKTLEKHDDFSDYVGDVFIMGGTLGAGNVTDFAEFNFYTDPAAANLVFQQLDCFVMGLNLTEKHGLKPEDKALFEKAKTDCPEMLNEMFDYILRHREIKGDLLPVHDLFALYAYSYRNAVIYDEVTVDVTEKGEKRGRVEVRDNGHPVYFGISGNQEHFHKFIEKTLLGLS